MLFAMPYADGSLHIPAEIVADAQALDLLIARSFKTDCHAYAKPPFGGPEHVLAYLANYTHRIAISNRRILSFDGQAVTLSWRDYADDNAPKTMQLHGVPSGGHRGRSRRRERRRRHGDGTPGSDPKCEER